LCDHAPAALAGDAQHGQVSATGIDQLLSGRPLKANVYSRPRQGETRLMLANNEKIEADSLDSALASGVYEGLKSALRQKPDAVLSEVETSGLTGRGGAGFPVGRKWRYVAQATRHPKYVICNADESEPLIFKDRVLIDANPHQILEGMTIAGYTTGSHEAYIYIRGEYTSQTDRLANAIRQAEDAHLLGEDILGSGYAFHIHLHRGAGAYICGEETALIESLEGKRGEPRLRPPYPPTSGLLGLPTLVNNVESYAAVPSIISRGAAWYRTISDYPTPGTKLYMLLGDIHQPGLFEAPFGLTLRQAIDEFGGGMRDGTEFYFALTGGAAGTIVSSELLDTPIDYTSPAKGISIGAGAFLVCDQTRSPVELLRELLHFFTVESCGKCTPCRVGTWRSLEILDRLIHGEGIPGDVDELQSLAEVMQDASFCGLGQSAAIPILTALAQFGPKFHQAENAP
jgi:NADH:ubiquinone oxidoreductase subunit F (NADH-binding)